MRNIFIFTLLMIIILTGFFYYIFYTPALIIKKVPSLIETYFNDVRLNEFEIGGQSVEYPNKLKLMNVRGSFDWQGAEFTFQIKQLDVLQFVATFKDRQTAHLRFYGMNVIRKGLEVKNIDASLDLKLAQTHVTDYTGDIDAGWVKVDAYECVKVHGHYQGNTESLKITDFKSYAYGGMLQGEGKVTFAPNAFESLDVEFKGLKSSEMRNFNKSLFSQIDSEFQGTLRVNRIEGQFRILALLAQMPNGGVLFSGLAQRIIDDMTDETKRYQLQTIMQDHRTLSFDQGEFRVLNINQNLASITFNFSNKDLDLQVQESINVDILRLLKKIAADR